MSPNRFPSPLALFALVVAPASAFAVEIDGRIDPSEWAGARHVTETHSGHEIHKEQPQLVIDAIEAVIDAVRAGKTRLEP